MYDRGPVPAREPKHQRRSRKPKRRSILIGVTIDQQLQYHDGLVESLIEAGWDVHVVSGPGPRLEELRAIAGVRVYPLPMRRKPNAARDLVAFFRWIWILGRARPDVTFIGTPKASLLGNSAAWLLRVPRRVYELLGLRLETLVGASRQILGLVERATAWFATEVICVSESLRTQATNMSLVEPAKALVLGSGSCNGVDIESHQRAVRDNRHLNSLAATMGLDRGVPTAGFVGRLTRDKGLPELTAALRILKSNGCDMQLLLVGAVDDVSGAQALEELAASGQTIIVAGYQEEVSSYYGLMDVFCLPSLREGLSTVLLEAMASHVVVVASDATGNVDLVVDQSTGYLVPRGDVHRLASALEAAVRDTARARRLAEAAFELVVQEFDSLSVRRRLRDHLTQAGPSDSSVR